MSNDESNKEDVKRDGVEEMSTLTQNINISLAELIKSNYQKIKATTPVNPPISKDDEWRKDTEWDKGMSK